MLKEKPYAVKKLAQRRQHPWKRPLLCAFTKKNGAPALRCPEFQRRQTRLNGVIDRISALPPNELASRDRAVGAPPYLRRNTQKVRWARPQYLARKERYLEQLRVNLKETRTAEYEAKAKYYFHLETFHDYDCFDLSAIEHLPVVQTLVIPRQSEIAKILQQNDENAVPRSYYSAVHSEKVMGPAVERDFMSIEELAFSDLVEDSINRPSIDGLQNHEYSMREVDQMLTSTKLSLLDWKRSLTPNMLMDEEVENSGGEDLEQVVDFWNQQIRKKRFKRRSFPNPQRECFFPPARLNQTFQNARPNDSFSTPKLSSFMQNSKPASAIPKRLQEESYATPRQNRRVATPQATRPTPTPKQSRPVSTPKPNRSVLPSAETTPVTTVAIRSRILNATPVRKSPRVLKAICYKE